MPGRVTSYQLGGVGNIEVFLKRSLTRKRILLILQMDTTHVGDHTFVLLSDSDQFVPASASSLDHGFAFMSSHGVLCIEGELARHQWTVYQPAPAEGSNFGVVIGIIEEWDDADPKLDGVDPGETA